MQVRPDSNFNDEALDNDILLHSLKITARPQSSNGLPAGHHNALARYIIRLF
jgi:hypothetical protein